MAGHAPERVLSFPLRGRRKLTLLRSLGIISLLFQSLLPHAGWA